MLVENNVIKNIFGQGISSEAEGSINMIQFIGNSIENCHADNNGSFVPGGFVGGLAVHSRNGGTSNVALLNNSFRNNQGGDFIAGLPFQGGISRSTNCIKDQDHLVVNGN